jgi:hypothetical protein
MRTEQAAAAGQDVHLSRFKGMVRHMLQLPPTVTECDINCALLARGVEDLAWYETRVQAILDYQTAKTS